MVIAVAGCLLSYLLCSRFILSSAMIRGESMMPTLRPGQLCLVEKWAYRLGDPRRGDIVVFKSPDHGSLSVKRIVAGPGDSVRLLPPRLWVNGVLAEESYLPEGTETAAGMMGSAERTLGTGAYFVLGDNRDVSEDSRYHGAIRREWIQGRVGFAARGLSFLPGFRSGAADARVR